MGSEHGGAAVAGQVELRAAIAALAAADVDALSDEASLQGLRELWPLVCAVQAQVARRVGRVHVRGAAKGDGFVSTRAFLRTRLCLNPGAGSTLLKASAGLALLPDTVAALQAGEVSVEHAAVLADAVGELGHQVLAGGVEKVLLEYARAMTPNELRDLVRELAFAVMSEEEATRRQARLHARRDFTAAKTFAGSVSVQGILDPVQGEALLAALAAYTAGPDPQGLAGRTPGQRRADALADICGVALAATDRPATGGDRPQVTVTVSLQTLQRGPTGPVEGQEAAAAEPDPLARLGDPSRLAVLGHCREPVCAETARRLACDAGIIPVLLGGRSEPLDIGRLTRTVPTGLRRALELRDGGCRFPGCSRPASWCDAHHVLFWARGGLTCLTNLVLLCQFHHSMVHEGHWRLQLDHQTWQVRVWRPDGRPHDLTSQPRGPTARPR